MKEGANPEMDRIAKLVSGRLKGRAVGPHPDPDLLSAFAEHALPDAERAQLVEHLGACSDCREILYLAMPDSAEAQRVLSFRPSLRSGFALRWGALVASVAILTGVFAARYSFYNAHRQSPAVVAAPAVSTVAKIADEKVPPELNAMRDAIAKKATSEPVAKVRPEAKHMTAKPQATLDFEESGQVRVLAPQNSDQSMNSSVQHLTINGRSEAPLTNRAASAASPASAPQPVGGLSRETNAFGLQAANSNVLTAGSRAVGNFGGMISDTTGAAVGKAKVTVVGPVGPKTATSDDSGRFSFDRLTPGLYSVKAEASGFKATEIKQVAVLVNGTPPVQVKLEPGSASEMVEVTGAAPALDKAVVSSALDSSTEFVGGQEQTAQLKLQKAAAANTRQAGGGTGGSAMPVPPWPQWTLSPEGSLQRSFDTGKSWQAVTVSTGIVFRALSAAGTNVWVGGNAGALYHSTDSGQTWAQLEPMVGGKKLDQDIVHLDFSDGQGGALSTSKGEVWTTSNGGQTWLRK